MANPLESPEIRAAIQRATYERLGAEALRDGLRKRGHAQDEIERIIAEVKKTIEEEKLDGH
jgi:hypothetical protein